MSLTIAAESPLTDDADFLVQGSEAALRAVYTEDECFTFTAAQLDDPKVTFLVARAANRPVGCVALVDCGTYGEIKRLYTVPMGRGRGTATELMDALETHAKAMGHTSVRLETGDKLVEAVRLYTILGYSVRSAFGDYEDLDVSLFMEKEL